MNKVGIGILTNGHRLDYLKECLSSFLNNCYYRPLVVGIFDNGSEDDTLAWLKGLYEAELPYGVEFRYEHSDVDLGCAAGTNRIVDLISDCEYAVHLESDFRHLTEEESGVDKMWLHRCIKWMDDGKCDYLYLRRMVGPAEMMAHWWAQWMEKIVEYDGEYMSCPEFWWSNNPHIRRTKALFESGTLPLDVNKDGAKGTEGWSQPELQAPSPPNTWIHKWGMFVHERPLKFERNYGCSKYSKVGRTSCKYGFYMDLDDPFCSACDLNKDWTDMVNHQRRCYGR
jgi:hypothetical protein